MSANDFLLDAGIRHQIFVQRYAGGQVRELLGYLRNMVSDVERKLLEAQTLSEAQRLTTQLREIQSVIDDGLERMNRGLLDSVSDLAEYEAEFAVKTLNTASTVDAVLPQSELLRALVTNTPMGLQVGNAKQELTIEQAAQTYSRKKSGELRRIIQTGFVEGATVQDLTSQVRRVAKRQRSQAEALVRTSINHISSEARRETHMANADILKGEEFVAVLDNRTTIGCAALDGKIFPFNRGPQTPRHWNCRSVRVPALDDRFQEGGLVGSRASKGSSFTGQVSAKRTYGGWLKDQSATFQDEVLGSDRGKLFRQGGLSIESFSDDMGRQYSLDELRLLGPVAFERAGI